MVSKLVGALLYIYLASEQPCSPFQLVSELVKPFQLYSELATALTDRPTFDLCLRKGRELTTLYLNDLYLIKTALQF